MNVIIQALKLDQAPSDDARIAVLRALREYAQCTGDVELLQGIKSAMPEPNPDHPPTDWLVHFENEFRSSADAARSDIAKSWRHYAGACWSELTATKRQRRLINPYLGAMDGGNYADDLIRRSSAYTLESGATK